jgi:hypothetical protein
MRKHSPEDPVSRARRRALRYQHVDGTFELTFGGAFLLMALCFYGLSRLAISDPSVSTGLLSFAPLVALGAGVYLIDALVRRLRMRITYPRTGYIAYPKPRPLKRSTRLAIWIGLPVFTAILLVLLFLDRAKFYTADQDYVSILMPPFFGLLFSGLWLIIGWKVSVPRFFFTAAVSFLVSVVLFLKGVGGTTGIAWLFGAMGAILCISGGLTLYRYLRRNPTPQGTPDE